MPLRKKKKTTVAAAADLHADDGGSGGGASGDSGPGNSGSGDALPLEKVPGLKDAATFYEFNKWVAFHPVHVGQFVLAWLMIAFGMFPYQFKSFSLEVNLAIFFGQSMIYLLVNPILMSKWMRFALRHNVPWVYLIAIYYFVYLQIIRFIQFLIEPEIVVGNYLFLASRQFLNGVPPILIVAYFFLGPARRRLTDEPDMLPVWWPNKRPATGLMLQLPPQKRAPIRQINAEQQYINIVTDKGEELIRMRLKDAVAQIPDGLGLQVHRSVWIANDRIDDIIYHNGNPRIIDIDGNIIPVSRSRVSDVKKMLKRRRVESLVN